MRLSHRVHTTAAPGEVWSLLTSPRRWPEFDRWLTRVDGAYGDVAEGMHLLGLARLVPIRIPIDVLRVVPSRELALHVRTLPGLSEHVVHHLVPAARGGTDITVVSELDGPFALFGVLPLWLATTWTARTLGARAAAGSVAA